MYNAYHNVIIEAHNYDLFNRYFVRWNLVTISAGYLHTITFVAQRNCWIPISQPAPARIHKLIILYEDKSGFAAKDGFI